MSKPLVTIVSVSYNQEKYIRDALDSFLKQETNFKYEVLIADDASTDSTPAIIQEYADKHPEIIKPILRKKNIGVAANFAETLSAATGKYIALCEGDDYWTDPNKLQMQADFLEKHEDYSLCFHPVKVIFENNEKKSSIWPNLGDEPDLSVKALLRENFVPTNSVMFHRQKYDKFPRNIMPVDWYLHLYHAQFGKIGFINRTMSVYRRHAGGVWWDSEANKDQLWKKHGISNTAMFLELLKIYGHNPEYRKVIYGSLSRTVSELAGAEDRFEEGRLKELITLYPEAAEIFLVNNYRQQQQHTSDLVSKQSEATALYQSVLDLRSELFKARNELHGLKNSRVLGRIIKARDFVGEARKGIQHAPRRALHKVRVIGAPVVPAPIRRSVKRAYKNARRRLTAKENGSEIRFEAVANKRWKDDMPLVSVVTAYYNAGQTIDETLNSLKSQTFKNFEVIIVNDGSTDRSSLSKLENLDKGHLKVKVISQINQGPAAARNNGIKVAAGKYIVCLDSDDMLEPTFIEKATLVLETNPDTALVTTHKYMFGVINEEYKNHEYDPIELFSNNMVICAAEFRKEAWAAVGGYKSKIGYEDWEFWLTLSEHGSWGKLIPELLFRYRTSLSSRYVEDQDAHWNNLKNIRSMHPTYKKIVKKLLSKHRYHKHVATPESAFVNLNSAASISQPSDARAKILITIPWMTFGGAETLIYNFCREVKGDFNISFVTGLQSQHEWEDKFKEITPNIYHLANLFEDKKLYVEFISYYIKSRNIDILHIIHNGFTFEMLAELKKRHPALKVITTMFNDRVEYFHQSISYQQHIDMFATDNEAVARHYRQLLQAEAQVTVIPNGINCYDEFNPEKFSRQRQRSALDIKGKELAVFFVGRLSEEKNPDVFLAVARELLRGTDAEKFRFYMIGDGPMRPEVEKTIASINNPRIQYLGYKSSQDVAKNLSAADIFVLPSAIEGFPLSILEAMAMGVVAVASDVGAVSDVVTPDEGFVVPAGSVEDISKSLEKLAADPKLLTAMKERSRKKIEAKYSNRVLGENYKALYKDSLRTKV